MISVYFSLETMNAIYWWGLEPQSVILNYNFHLLYCQRLQHYSTVCIAWDYKLNLFYVYVFASYLPNDHTPVLEQNFKFLFLVLDRMSDLRFWPPFVPARDWTTGYILLSSRYPTLSYPYHWSTSHQVLTLIPIIAVRGAPLHPWGGGGAVRNKHQAIFEGHKITILFGRGLNKKPLLTVGIQT